MVSVRFGNVYKLSAPAAKMRVAQALTEKKVEFVVRETEVTHQGKRIRQPGFWSYLFKTNLSTAIAFLFFRDPPSYERVRDEALSGVFVFLGDSLEPYRNIQLQIQNGEKELAYGDRTLYPKAQKAFHELLRKAQDIHADDLLKQVPSKA